MSDTITCEWCAEEIPAGSSRCPKCQGSVNATGKRVQGAPLAARPTVPAEKPKAPAGWYDHPTMADTRRYWDGQRWTDHIAPGAAAKPPIPAEAPSQPQRDDTAFAWTLALLPLVWIVLYLAAPKAGISAWAWGGILALTVLLSTLDARTVRSKGHDDIGAAMGWGVPLYLIERTKKVGSSAFIPIIWFAGVAGAILTYFVAPGVYDFGANALSSQIQGQLREQTGTAATVNCPRAHHVTKGDVLTCTVADSGGQVSEVQVAFKGDGSYTWQVAR